MNGLDPLLMHTPHLTQIHRVALMIKTAMMFAEVTLSYLHSL